MPHEYIFYIICNLFNLLSVYVYKLLKFVCLCFLLDLFEDTCNKENRSFSYFKKCILLKTAIYYMQDYMEE